MAHKTLLFAAAVLAGLLPRGELAAATVAHAVTFQSDAGHTGQTSLPYFRGKLKLAWSQTLSGPVSYPVIAQGLVFVTASASSGTEVYALDKASGAIVWSLPISDTYHWSTLAFNQGKLFEVNSTGLLNAYEASSGTLEWSAQMPHIYSHASPPTATHGVVYLSGYENLIYAVSESNGSILWEGNVSYGGGQSSSPAIGGGSVFVSYTCQYYAFAAASGQQIWEDNEGCSGGQGWTPAYYRGRVFVRDSSVNHVINAQTGAITGTFPAVVAPAIRAENDKVYIYSLSNGLNRVDAATGLAVWTYAGDGSLSTAPLLVDNYVVEGSSSGNLYVVNAQDGSLIWSQNLGVPIPSPQENYDELPLSGLAAADGLLVVPTASKVFAFVRE